MKKFYIHREQTGFYVSHVEESGAITATWSRDVGEAAAFPTVDMAIHQVQSLRVDARVIPEEEARVVSAYARPRALQGLTPSASPRPEMLRAKPRVQEAMYLECATALDLFAGTVNEYLRQGWRIGPVVQRSGNAFVQMLYREIEPSP